MESFVPEIEELRSQLVGIFDEQGGIPAGAIGSSGEYTGWVADFHESLMAHPVLDNPNSKVVLGLFYDEIDDYDRSESLLETLGSRDGELAFLYRVYRYLYEADYEAALDLAVQAENDGFTSAVRIQAAANYSLGLVGDSLKLFSKGLRGGDGVCGHLLGEILEDIGEMESAISAYQIGAMYGDELSQGRLNELNHGGDGSNVEHDIDIDIDRAIADLDDFHPSPSPLSVLRRDTDSDELGFTSNLEDSLIEYMEQELRSGNPRGAMVLGGLYLNREDYVRAIESFQKGVALGDAEAALGLASVYRTTGAVVDAIGTARLAMSMGSLDALLVLSSYLSEEGNFDEAIQLATKAVEVGVEGSNTELGRLFVNIKRYEEAAEVFERGIESGESQSAIFLGKLLEHYDYFEDATEAYKAGAEMGDSESARLAAMLLESNGDSDGARKYFEMSAELSE